jgi:hypothetical protein
MAARRNSSAMPAPTAYLVQLPFPSAAHPDSRIRDYYIDYGNRFAAEFPEFFVPEGALWELPLWVAHLAGMLAAIGRQPLLVDLSHSACEADACLNAILRATAPGDAVYLSPLAQNFGLAVQVSRRLQQEGRRTVLGGNMAPLAVAGDATHVHRGQIDPAGLAAIAAGRHPGQSSADPARDRGSIRWVPDYRLLGGYRGKVPMLRLAASHGCLHACAFCGDAWSRQLHVVEPEALERELAQLEDLFPETRFIYIGDKTFGQSRQAVANLLQLFERRRRYRLIVQTHILQINDELIETMHQLGVVVVEVGFETADAGLLVQLRKASRGIPHALAAIERLAHAGFKVVLNVMGGLPAERPESHARTIDFLESASHVWLYNLYNFVPYPLTPYFSVLRDRIFDWEFHHWREDAPPVFHPYYLSAQESWGLFLDKVAAAHGAILRQQPIGVRRTA